MHNWRYIHPANRQQNHFAWYALRYFSSRSHIVHITYSSKFKKIPSTNCQPTARSIIERVHLRTRFWSWQKTLARRHRSEDICIGQSASWIVLLAEYIWQKPSVSTNRHCRFWRWQKTSVRIHRPEDIGQKTSTSANSNRLFSYYTLKSQPVGEVFLESTAHKHTRYSHTVTFALLRIGEIVNVKCGKKRINRRVRLFCLLE